MNLLQKAIQEYLEEHHPGWTLVTSPHTLTYVIRPVLDYYPYQEIYIRSQQVQYYHHTPLTDNIAYKTINFTPDTILLQITEAINHTKSTHPQRASPSTV